MHGIPVGVSCKTLLGSRSKLFPKQGPSCRVFGPHLLPPANASLRPRSCACLLCEYWGALQEMWPEEYESLNNLGVFALHWLFPEVFGLCQAGGGWSRDVIKRLLTETSLNSEFWRTFGHAWQLSHAPKCLGGLVEYLEGRLPKAC